MKDIVTFIENLMAERVANKLQGKPAFDITDILREHKEKKAAKKNWFIIN